MASAHIPGARNTAAREIDHRLRPHDYSVLLCWIYLHTAGSVLIATLAHGAMNLFQGIFLGGVDPAMHYWLLAGVYGVAALVIVLVFGPSLSQRPLVAARSGSRAQAM